MHVVILERNRLVGRKVARLFLAAGATAEVLDEPGPLERVHGAVHRRQGDVGMLGLHSGGQVLGGHVTTAGQEGSDHGPPGCGHPPTGAAERVEVPLLRVVGRRHPGDPTNLQEPDGRRPCC
jgi:hypothetical protein